MKRKVLLVECCLWHEETLLNWVFLLAKLGYDVDLYVASFQGMQQLCRLTRLGNFEVFPITVLSAIDPERYDFMILNTLINESYYFPAHAGIPFPNVQFLEQFDLPTISCIHEPVLWKDSKPLFAVALRSDVSGYHEFNLFSNGLGAEKNKRGMSVTWKQDGDRIILHWLTGGKAGIADTCTRIRLPSDMTSSGKHAVITFTAAAQKYLQTACQVDGWILPTYFADRTPVTSRSDVIVPGEINYDRKNFSALLAAASEIRRLRTDKIWAMGGARGFFEEENSSHHLERFRREIREQCIEEKVFISGYLPYGDFYRRLQTGRFILPLIDETIDEGSYLVKLSAAVAQSIAFNTPLIVNEEIARLFGLQLAMTYKGCNVAEGLHSMNEISTQHYAAMKASLLARRAAILQQNLDTLKRLINSITQPAVGQPHPPNLPTI